MEYHQSLTKKYPSISPSILRQYNPPETKLVVNKDPSLYPIDISEVIPKPPPEHTIDGFGKDIREQKFHITEMPKRLKRLVSRHETAEGIWDTLERDRDLYKEEILWIKVQWHRIINGYWFYCYGTPLYISGTHYFYVNFWSIDIGIPEYRYRDRKFFLFEKYCKTTTKIFDPKFLNKHGKPIADEDGNYRMIDTGRRICSGLLFPKHRREGASYRGACCNYVTIITSKNARGGIQAMDSDTALDVFSVKLKEPWKKLPFFLRPIYSGSTDAATSLVFKPQAMRITKKGSLLSGGEGLQSFIDFATTAKRGFYDGGKLKYLHVDELGKTLNENVDERNQVLMRCLEMGGGRKITGMSIHTSTVAEQKKQGGENFKTLADKSHWEDRNANGQTMSKLFVLFISAADGLEGFIDEYGYSVIETPTEEQAEYIGGDIGALEYLENMNKKLLQEGKIDEYNENLRQLPIYYKHCFIGDQSETGFNLIKINERMYELDDWQEATVRGNFIWSTPRDSSLPSVIWEPDEYGKWLISYLPPPNRRSQLVKRNGAWYPSNPNGFITGIDPYRFTTVESARKSDGGGATFWVRDLMIDPIDRSVENWESHRFVCTYSNRVDSKKDFADDMLKQTIFYGGLAYPERNIPLIEDTWRDEWGFGGLLKYDTDERGRSQPNPGYYIGNNDKVKQQIFSEFMNYIEVHSTRERHIEILEECKKIEGIEKLKNYDLFAACGGCLLGLNDSYGDVVEHIKQQDKKVDIGRYVRTYNYD